MGKVVSFFGAYLPQPLLEEFLAKSNHPIYELEILPLLVAVKIWSTNIVGKLVVHYLDNDAARSAYFRAHASIDLGAALIAEYVEFEYKCRFSPWFARVASHSNPSDEPSRMNFEAPWLKQAKLNWSCQSTCRSGESSGALTHSIKSLCVNVDNDGIMAHPTHQT